MLTANSSPCKLSQPQQETNRPVFEMYRQVFMFRSKELCVRVCSIAVQTLKQMDAPRPFNLKCQPATLPVKVQMNEAVRHCTCCRLRGGFLQEHGGTAHLL